MRGGVSSAAALLLSGLTSDKLQACTRHAACRACFITHHVVTELANGLADVGGVVVAAVLLEQEVEPARYGKQSLHTYSQRHGAGGQQREMELVWS